jgi:Uncharacterized alpha/beta hydrolase domain (DUF2235)
VTNGHDGPESDAWTTVLKQVWFSGGHCDVGGGKTDSRLSDIALAWMISQLVENKLLEFDKNYLLSSSSAASAPWATSLGVNNDISPTIMGHFIFISGVILKSLKDSLSWIIRYVFRAPKVARAVAGERTPSRYVPIRDYVKKDTLEKFQTNEYFHDSLGDRELAKGKATKERTKDIVYWPCAPLKDFSRSKDEGGAISWTIPHQNHVNPIIQGPVSGIESFFKGHIRDPGTCKRICFYSFPLGHSTFLGRNCPWL